MRNRAVLPICAALLLWAWSASAQDGAVQNRVAVRGQWTITITNPDGTVASRHEFDNALVGAGQNLLVNLLGRSATITNWGVLLDGSVRCGGATTGGACAFYQSDNASANRRPLSVTSDIVNVTNIPRMRLTGGIRAQLSGSITRVSTLAVESEPSSGFTEHVLPAPIPVAAGQFVDVTVFISFS
jgi:hypothetical protein